MTKQQQVLEEARFMAELRSLCQDYSFTLVEVTMHPVTLDLTAYLRSGVRTASVQVDRQTLLLDPINAAQEAIREAADLIEWQRASAI